MYCVAYDGANFKLSKPCKNCCEACVKYGINKVAWTDEDGKLKTDYIENIVDSCIVSSGDRVNTPNSARVS